MGCQCKAGYVKPAAGDVCEPAPMGLGAECDVTAPTSCSSDPEFTHCEAGADSKGYCTKTDCSSAADCSGGYACDMAVTPSVCRRPPKGLSMSCASDADCAGTEATYCDTFVTHSCLVQGCNLTADDCFIGFECCDLSSFGIAQPLCVAAGACTT